MLVSEHAQQIRHHPDRREKATPGQAELDGAQIGFVGRAVGVIQDSHGRFPLFVPES